MKRNRSEHVMSTIGQYLRKRQHMESEHYKKNELKLQQSLHEMALCGSVANESSARNAIGFSSINRDVTAIDQQFTKLKLFISEAIEPFKSELSYLLFPVFVHLYLEMIINAQKTPAQKFRTRHQGLFAEVPEYKGVIENLANVVSSQDLAKFPIIKSFRENKYTLKLSEEVCDYLMRYLKGSNHLILLQILNLHLEVKVQNPQKVNLHLYEDKKVDSSKDKNAAKTTAASASDANANPLEVELKALQDAIRKVQDGPPSLPSICLYSFTNTFQGLSSVNLSSDISLFAGGFEDCAIRLWSLTPTPLVSVSAPNGASRIRLACDFDLFLNSDSEEQQLSHSTDKRSEMKTLRAHSGPVYGVTFVPDSQILLSCSQDTTVRAWNISNFSNVASYRGHNYSVWDIDCSLGTYFATGSQDRTAKLWYLDRTYPVRIFSGHSMDVDCVKFHPNGNYIATGSSDKTVRLWNIQDGKMVRMFQGHRGTVYSLAFSPNGQLLASAGEDRRIRIWDLAAGSLMKELRGHIDTVYSLCFSRDSSALASGGLDGTIRLWDVRKGISTAGNTVDNHTSPELLSSYPSKSTGLLHLQYPVNNMLVAVGAKIN